MFSSVVLSLAALVLAPGVLATVYDVTVGGSAGNLTFTPEAIGAVPGDQVVFHFEQKNHTATQSSFASPCGPKAGGFSSGFMPVPANQTDNFPTYTITVNDTQPIWVYCAQAANTAASHCGQGMVFAVNCGADGTANSFTNFKNAALAIGAALQANSTSSSAAAGSPYGAPTGTVASSAPASTTAAAAAATHTVVVGANGTLEFNPQEVTAAPNDVVVFQFVAKNHTITQSSFPAPCQKLASTSTSGQVGFDSGFMPVAANSTEFPTFSIVVNDTTPIWAYCRQTDHCESGMVFAINANDSSSKSFSAFLAEAKASNATTGAPAASASSASGATTTAGAASGASRTVSASAGLGLGLIGAAFVLLF